MPVNQQKPKQEHKPKVGVSSCLLGQLVRYDGGHSQSDICTEQLQNQFDFVPFCPEVAAGFGTPRAPIQLVGERLNPRLEYAGPQPNVSNTNDSNLAEQLTEGYLEKLEQVGELDGYITKSRSPSCGNGSTPVYGESGEPLSETGSGLFISAVKKRYPALPIIEETALEQPEQRELFITQVYSRYKAKN